jgi:uncharacterized protein YecE (DUF72 family)
MPIIAGTSGWQYRDWRGQLYPPGLPVSRWLERYAEKYPTVENNGTFYRLASADTFAAWHAQLPPGFVMAIKASRYLTHVRRLRDPAEPVARLMAAAAGLGDRLGPVLLQLPPNMPADAAALDECLRQFARPNPASSIGGGGGGSSSRSRICVEFRHPSWWTREISELLQAHDAATCWADRLGRPLGPLWRTAGWGYLRLHEGAAQPWPRYGRQALRSWISRISDTWPPDAEVFAYFNNDQGGAAPADATEFADLARQAGWGAAQPAAASKDRRQHKTADSTRP